MTELEAKCLDVFRNSELRLKMKSKGWRTYNPKARKSKSKPYAKGYTCTGTQSMTLEVYHPTGRKHFLQIFTSGNVMFKPSPMTCF